MPTIDDLLTAVDLAQYGTGAKWDNCPEWAHSGQRRVWESKATDVVICAGAQGGKTALAPALFMRETKRAAEWIRAVRRANYLLIGPTLQLLQPQAIPTFQQELAGLGEWKGTPPQFHFYKGVARAVFGLPENLSPVIMARYANDSSNLESVTAYGAIWDEAGQSDNKEASYEAMLRRISAARGDGFGRVFYPSTPYVWNWFKRRLVDRADGTNVEVINWPTWANPLQSEKHIRDLLEQGMPEWRWRMMYLGEWTRPAGAVFDCFDSRLETDQTGPTNVVAPFVIPDHWDIHVGVDFGSANTAAATVAVSPEGQIFVISTYHKVGDDPRIHVERIKEKAGRPIRSAWGGAPSEDEWRKRWAAAGLMVLRPPMVGTGSLEAQLAQVYQAFRTKKVKIFSTCNNLIAELERMSYKLDGDGRVTDLVEDKSTYHRADALRYVVSSLTSSSPVTVVTRQAKRKQEEDDFWQIATT